MLMLLRYKNKTFFSYSLLENAVFVIKMSIFCLKLVFLLMKYIILWKKI